MNIKERIVSGHLAKTLDEPLSDLSLCQGGKLVTSGTGKLFINVEGHLAIEVIAKTIPFRFDPKSQKGVIIPEEEYYQMTAKTCDGQTCKADKLYAKNVTHSINKPAEANFEPAQITITANSNSISYSSFEAFVSPCDHIFSNRVTQLGETNPVFEDQTNGYWLAIEKPHRRGRTSERDKLGAPSQNQFKGKKTIVQKKK